MSKLIAGTAYVKADGKQYDLAGSLSVSPTEKTREGKAGLSGVTGYTETPRVPYIEGSFYTTSGLSIKEIEAITDATVTAELANGKTYVLKNAWTAGEPVVDAASGETTIRFEGVSCTEL